MTPLTHLYDREEAREVLRRLARSHHVRLADAARGTCRRPEVVAVRHAVFRVLRARGWANARTARALGLDPTTVRTALLGERPEAVDVTEAFFAGENIEALAARTGRPRLSIERAIREAMGERRAS